MNQRTATRQSSTRPAADASAQRSTKRPVLRFVLVFGLLLGVFEALGAIPAISQRYFPAYLRLNARAGAAILRTLGYATSAAGTQIQSPRFAIELLRGCDAIEPSAVFLAAMIAFPVAVRTKLPGALLGTLLLSLVNLVRIVSLFIVGVHYPRLFQMMHVDVWQAIFIFLAILLWVFWARWAVRTIEVRGDVAAARA